MKYKFQQKLSNEILGYVDASSLENAQKYFSKIKHLPLDKFLLIFVVEKA
mgnify:CR=1 FL=1|tara:strand:+ start:239 stop:388 length:150 start_codon:yes stop_codon:yes gene_type:complete